MKLLRFYLWLSQVLFWFMLFKTILEWFFKGWQQGLVGLMITTLLFGVWVWCEGRMVWMKGWNYGNK
jgi:hypothetical protein